MTEDNAKQALFKAFTDTWPGLSAGVPIVAENESGDQGPFYAQITITDVVCVQQTLGGPGTVKWQSDAIVVVKLFGPHDQGRTPLDQLFKLVRQIYQGQRLNMTAGDDGVVCRATSPKTIGTDGQYFQLQALTPVRWWETR